MPTDPDSKRPLAQARAAPARAVIWGSRAPLATLTELMRCRNLLPEHVDSAPAALLAGLRPGAAPAALVLVSPADLSRAGEVVELFRAHVPEVRCWSFRPPCPGDDGPGVLEPLDEAAPLPLVFSSAPAMSLDGSPAAAASTASGASPGRAGCAEPIGGTRCDATRLSRAELAMLLGPTRTFQSPAGGAG